MWNWGQEFTVKKDINDCCREVLQHHKSQRWFWMQTSSQNPQKKTKRNCWDLLCFKKVKKNPLIFRSLPQLPKKYLLCRSRCVLIAIFSQRSSPRFCRIRHSECSYSGFLSMVQLGAVPVPGEAICAFENTKKKHDTGLVDWDFSGGQSKVYNSDNRE